MMTKLKLLAVATVAMVLSGPAVALAQTVGAMSAPILAAPSVVLAATADTGEPAVSASILSAIGTALLGVLASPDALSVIFSGVVLGGAWLARRLWKDKAEARLRAFAQGVEHAYFAVESFAAKTANTVDDKLALALKLLNEQMARHGYALTVQEAEDAKLRIEAMHGASKAAAKQAVQTAAQLAAQGIATALPTVPALTTLPQTPRG
ncbi:hypothetical protein HV824_33980 [Myxococcus sp. AM009]|uniref:hypothetical protein n=1 Tax=unclassified Myxococcus TaxID=2648731 RepID=UPI0015952D64|nr:MULTISPECIES: hypothetical protein [unclassified Myxococcus]NVJ03094.1 hypothetical protein [Myxococcus sp. AM009]NVJ19438.1 hypothetical protein [Myxococcus sp. AM010]